MLECGILFWIPTEAFPMDAVNATPSVSVHSLSTKLARSRWSLSLLFCSLVKRESNKATLRSLNVCAQSLTAHDVGKNWDHSGAVVCVITPAATCPLTWVVAALQNCKANKTLTRLTLHNNNIKNTSATALADALQATVSACGQTAFQECASCCHRCCFARWCEQLASPSCCAVCVFFFFVFLVSGRKKSRGVEYCSRVVLKLMWHCFRIELDQLSVSLLAFAWLRSTTSCHQDCACALRTTTVLWFL